MRTTTLLICSTVLLLALPRLAAAVEIESFESLGDSYDKQIQPLLASYCLECHSAAEKKGELDLEVFGTLSDVRHASRVWQKVAEMLDNGEMPPKDADQPTPDQRKQLRSWVARYLNAEANASAGDPGPVVLRRLNNAQYTYTIRDLTGVPLDPARELPTDSAAGEGFTNTGNALVMSPALLSKYFDAGKGIAKHAVLLPDGFRFSPSATNSDWTNDVLARIRGFYGKFAETGGGTQVNLQGIVFNTNDGGRLPIEKYLLATLQERDAISSGTKSIDAVAREHQLNAKYLGMLWNALNEKQPSLLLDIVRKNWRDANPEDAIALAGEINRWQNALFRFSSVGHIGKVGGPTAWQESVTPLTARQELRLKLPASPGEKELKLYLVASDAGDGNDNDYVVWERPRLVAAGRQDLLLRDVRNVSQQLLAQRERIFAATVKYLSAALEVTRLQAEQPGKLNQENNVDYTASVAAVAERHQIDSHVLLAWIDYLGIGMGSTVQIDSHFSEKIDSSAGYDFVKGWGSHNTPLLVANSSDQHVRIPGNMKPHGIAVHPTPTLQVGVGWRSPDNDVLHVHAKVQHAHPECGNGVTWSLELRRGNTRKRLAAGISHGANVVDAGPIENVEVKPGDLLSLLIGPRDANHSCDLTAVDITLKGKQHAWDLAQDVSANVDDANPHADSFGNEGVWHFYTEPVSGTSGFVIPAGSLLAKWQEATSAEEKEQLAKEVEALLLNGPPEAKDSADAALYHQLASFGGPLLSAARSAIATSPTTTDSDASAWGLDPALFGKHPDGHAVEAENLCVKAPAIIEVRLPAELVEDCEFVASAALHAQTGSEGSVQLQVLLTDPMNETGLLPTAVTETNAGGMWTSNNRRIAYGNPILVTDGSKARTRLETDFTAFRNLFPIALCYTKIVPVDEVVTLTLFYREDEHLQRLMLSEAEIGELNKLWEELHFVSHDALTLVDALEQLLEYASQDADPKVFEPMRGPINERAAAFRRQLVDAEPAQLDALIRFASLAYRRPLADDEERQLRQLYQTLRAEELPHDEAFRLTLARIFVAPAFLYRLEYAPRGDEPAPVNDWELANRLSYFLWSSMPDEQLRTLAASGQLSNPQQLAAQSKRMLGDERVRRLAIEFACQWLHIYEFDTLDEKSERHFPAFVELRDDMYEEPIRFFTDLFQHDGSVLSMFKADHTFLNAALAEHYGISGVDGDEWQRVDGVNQFGRGGLLGFSATLAKQSGASRTSPILRGNWISEVLLGERLPRPPKDVPQLPDDETATEGLTVRQLVEMHTRDERCATCHARIDPFGFALEGYDAIGRRRFKDLAERPIDTQTTLQDGTPIEGINGLTDYLLTTRRDAVMHQFCRKLLGYALGRGVQLSDEPLLAEMQQKLAENDYRFSVAVETIVLSRQFREIRGQDSPLDEEPEDK